MRTLRTNAGAEPTGNGTIFATVCIRRKDRKGFCVQVFCVPPYGGFPRLIFMAGFHRLGFLHAATLLALVFSVGVALGDEQDDEAGEEVETQTLRERLTEREDENRVEDPYTVELWGRPLSLNGQYEVILDRLERIPVGATTNAFGETLFEQEVELETFYTFGPHLFFFAQGRLRMDEQLDANNPDQISDEYFERGELWLYAEEIGGSPFSLELGRLDFEDDRLWWWDADLDAIRATMDAEPFSLELSVARELFSTRSDRGYIDPEQEDVLRLIGEAGWELGPEHELKVFALYQDDRSHTETPGELVRLDREDESDAELTWVGIRFAGASELDGLGVLGYWVDAARVGGKENLVSLVTAEDEDEPSAGGEEDGEEEGEEGGDEKGSLPRGRGAVDEVIRQTVRGWGLDLGMTWLLPITAEPRLTLAFATASGDDTPDNGTDSAFRQTGVHANEPGFGGVERFNGYGEILDPELSNLSVFTAGIGFSLLESSSIDVVYHAYRLHEPADSLRNARLDAELTGTSRDLGQGFDVVLGLEEWERIEFTFSASLFQTGEAFGTDRNQWIVGSLGEFRFAF